VRIHKAEIAKRHLEAAAALFLARGDFLAVITLAGAAEEVLGSLVQRQGKTSMLNHLVEIDKRLSGGRDHAVVVREVNGIRNALKHAKCPSEDEIEIEDEGEALAMLGRALVNFGHFVWRTNFQYGSHLPASARSARPR
jgi:hypothetical protein